ncbi:hypothetical protein AB0I16_18925 [Streptomyces sp. NPDC050703]|uniref:hypothetical protein n=1 Tax=Streptomyces sp. NPDC050703 TaxID=3157218 RepID=UPI00343DCF54
MKHTKSPEGMLDRLRAVDWTDYDRADDHAASRAALLREYLRRAALWAERLDGTDEWPIFDMARRVDASVRARRDLADQLVAYASKNIPTPRTREACLMALHWAALSERSPQSVAGTPDPFEPLLAIYERGGGFTVENGTVDFLLIRVRIQRWQDHVSHAPVVTLDSAALDSLDR